jgi:hypothetical protein
VGADVNADMLFETLQVVGIGEVVRTVIRLSKKPMKLCVSRLEERERGVGADVNAAYAVRNTTD